MRSTTGTARGTAARRVLRGAGLLGAATAVAWCATVLLAAPAQADGPDPDAGLVGQVVGQVTAPARPAVATTTRAVRDVARPVVRATPAAPAPTTAPGPAPAPVATTTHRATTAVRDLASATRRTPVVRDVPATTDRLLPAALTSTVTDAADGVARVADRVTDRVADRVVDRLVRRLDAAVGGVQQTVREVVVATTDLTDEAVPAVEGAVPAHPRAPSARTGHREHRVDDPAARGDRAPQAAPVVVAVPPATLRPVGPDHAVDHAPGPAPGPASDDAPGHPVLPSYVGTPAAPTPLGWASAGAAYLSDGPLLGDRAGLGPVVRTGGSPVAAPGCGPGCTPD